MFKWRRYTYFLAPCFTRLRLSTASCRHLTRPSLPASVDPCLTPPQVKHGFLAVPVFIIFWVPNFPLQVKHGFLAAPDEPIFAGERVEYYGQPLGLLVASSKVGCTAISTPDLSSIVGSTCLGNSVGRRHEAKAGEFATCAEQLCDLQVRLVDNL